MKEATLYKKNQDKTVSCFLCNHFCMIAPQRYGVCKVRMNIGGKLFSLNYSDVIACNVDPVEKKPLFHFFPGSRTYSIASPGCNFSCGFCQNWSISQLEDSGYKTLGFEVSPEDVALKAKEAGCKSIAYTYTEPTVFFEFAKDIAVEARKNGLLNVFVTNGYMSRDALEKIGPYLDGVNVDLKSFSNSFYKKNCKASLKPVLENIELFKKKRIWLEITTLIIPGLNDSKSELKKIASFIASVGQEVPWHISRFFPAFNFLTIAPTNNDSLEMAYEIGKSCGLRYVYIGNSNIDFCQNTFCPDCGKALIKRLGFESDPKNALGGICGFCGFKLDGVF